MNASDCTIRAAVANDAEVIAAFNSAMALETEGRRLDPAAVRRGVGRVLADARLGTYHVVERAGQVVGQLLVTYEFSDWRDGLFWWIQSVYVAPAARRGGVYRALYEHVLAQARATAGVCGVRLYVDQDNTAAQEVYLRLGMTETAYRMYEVDWGGPSGE